VARSSSGLRHLLTLGGQYPVTVGAIVIAMALATVAGTASQLAAGLLVLETPSLEGDWLGLAEVWRLVSWPLFQGPLPGSLLALLFGGFMMLWLGRQLSFAWSERRFLVRILVITAGAALATELVLVPLASPLVHLGWPLADAPPVHFGIWPVANALLVTWGLLFPGQRLSWFGALEMSGGTVAKVVAVATPIWALVVGPPLAYLPHLFAIGVAWLLVAGGPRRGWWRLRSWWQQRRLERQRRRFKVVTTGREPKPPQWMN
jgi:hypothetical protein